MQAARTYRLRACSVRLKYCCWCIWIGPPMMNPDFCWRRPLSRRSVVSETIHISNILVYIQKQDVHNMLLLSVVVKYQSCTGNIFFMLILASLNHLVRELHARCLNCEPEQWKYLEVQNIYCLSNLSNVLHNKYGLSHLVVMFRWWNQVPASTSPRECTHRKLIGASTSRWRNKVQNGHLGSKRSNTQFRHKETKTI
jgi:hypothetical protein